MIMVTSVPVTFSNVETPSECAKICIQAKFCSCTSFSFNDVKLECITNDRYAIFINLFCALWERKYLL